MILATDLDGTFLGGEESHRQELYQLIRLKKELTLTFVTGRGLESVLPLFEDPYIPRPEYIICDVGATIVHGDTLEPVQQIQSDIEANWPGAGQIRNLLNEIPGLIYQEVPQQRRCSFFIQHPSLMETASEKLQHLRCDLIYSAGKYLDILPGGVNKGATLSRLVHWMNTSPDEVLVAGDTFNDFSMYTCGFKGVVVGEAEHRLTEATSSLPGIFHAQSPGAGGILESFSHFSEWRRFLS